MNSQFHQGQRENIASPNPLDYPPSLVRNRQAQMVTNNEIQLDPSNPSTLIFNDFMQQSSNSKTAPAPAIAHAPHTGMCSNQSNADMIAASNLKEQLLTSMASQLISQRSMLMNYELPGTNLLLSRLGQQKNQIMPVELNPGFISRMNERKCIPTGETNVSDGRLQQASVSHVPCQARGMSTDHNALSAYLEIPNDAIHGLHLMCSHPTCRSAGVKFRYCFFCKKPVTKQNFRSRHLHADLAKEANLAAAVSRKRALAPKANKSEAVKSSNNQVFCTPIAPSVFPAPSCQTSVTSIAVQSSDSSLQPKPVVQQLLQLSGNSSAGSKEASNDSINGRMTPEGINNYRLAWNAVLKERPTDLTLFPLWISKVISLSDTRKVDTCPLSKLDENLTPRECKWESLVWERPKGNQDDEEMTAWLVKVLETSSPGNSLQHGFTGSPPALSPKCSFESHQSHFYGSPGSNQVDTGANSIYLHTFDDSSLHALKKRKV